MKHIRPLIGACIFLSIITGVVYPYIVTLIGKYCFPIEANGSLLVANNQVIGSSLIGQNFTKPQYLWGRISATANLPYNPLASGGSNFAPTNSQLIDEVKARLIVLKPKANTPVPIDLVTSSASGLDPEISIAAAYFQIGRIAKSRHIDPDKVQDIINRYAKYPKFDFWGEPRVNVLQVNLELDRISYRKQK